MIRGKHTYGNPNILWNQRTNCYCGNFCSFANNITIYCGGNHNTSWITTYPFGTTETTKIFSINVNNLGHPFTNGNVIIGNDVWIGNNVSIMSGITIGDGSIIAANSNVVKNVEPYSMYGGNPAKLIKYRFTPEQIEKLLKIKWWDWDDEKINENLNLICSSDIDKFLEKFA
jgi:acetyltransferase-like isoleucine patch superfamily enzyme